MVVKENVECAVVIDDEVDVRHLLEMVLTQSGFEVISASNGSEGIEAVRRHSPILTMLDVSMPGIDGFAAASRIREFSSTYIIMVTARSDEIDVVEGLHAGADDYIVKPFRPRELRARVEAVLRRPRNSEDSSGDRVTIEGLVDEPTQTHQLSKELVLAGGPEESVATEKPEQPEQPEAVQTVPTVQTVQTVQTVHAVHAVQVEETPDDGLLRFKGIELDRHTRIVFIDGGEISLTRTEFDLLSALMESGRRVRSKADLVLTLRGESYVTTYFVNDADKRAVEVHMTNLRRKIGDSTATPKWIETVRGVGYRLAQEHQH